MEVEEVEEEVEVDDENAVLTRPCTCSFRGRGPGQAPCPPLNPRNEDRWVRLVFWYRRWAVILPLPQSGTGIVAC